MSLLSQDNWQWARLTDVLYRGSKSNGYVYLTWCIFHTLDHHTTTISNECCRVRWACASSPSFRILCCLCPTNGFTSEFLLQLIKRDFTPNSEKKASKERHACLQLPTTYVDVVPIIELCTNTLKSFQYIGTLHLVYILLLVIVCNKYQYIPLLVTYSLYYL